MNSLKAERTSIEGVGDNLIGIPTTTTHYCKKREEMNIVETESSRLPTEKKQ